MSNAKLKVLAKFVEERGKFMVNSGLHNQSGTFFLRVSSDALPIMEDLQATFGGQLRKGHQSHGWLLRKQADVERCITTLVDYWDTLRPQASIVLEAVRIKLPRPDQPNFRDLQARRRQLAIKLKELNNG